MTETPEPTGPTPEEIAAKKKADNRQANIWAAGILVALLAICGGCQLAQQSHKTDPEVDRSNAAIAACESSVRDELKAPTTAKFSDERYTDSDPSWRVTGAVDAENGFGAMIRNRFECTLTRNGDSYATTAVNVG
jgi:hypothetical protein